MSPKKTKARLARRALFRLLTTVFLVTLDADGSRLPNDWYLNLAGQVSAAIASGRSIAAGVPMAK